MIPKKDFYRLGFISDASQRISKIHFYFRNRVAAARDAIYKLGAPIKGAFPESQLRDFSLVPTFVCYYLLLVSASVDHTFVTRMHLLIYLGPWDSTSIVRLQLIYYMSLSWVFSNQYSGTFYVYFMQHLGPTWWPLLMHGMSVYSVSYLTRCLMDFGIGFVKSHPSERVRSVTFPPMSQTPVNVQPGILKMFFK